MFRSRSPLRGAFAGAIGGLVATLAMSVLMLAARAAGLTPQLPPARIAREATMTATGTPPSEGEERALAAAAHLGFGSAVGSLFGLLLAALGPPGRAASVATGLVLASVVYLVSYQGWVPALRILPPASEDDPNRVRTMVAAHGIYAVALGLITRRLLLARPGSR